MLQWSLSTVSELSNLDINPKDTLHKEILNVELIVSVINIMATSQNVFAMNNVVAVVNFSTNVLYDIKVAKDEINEVKTVHLVKIIVPFLFGAPRCPQ